MYVCIHACICTCISRLYELMKIMCLYAYLHVYRIYKYMHGKQLQTKDHLKSSQLGNQNKGITAKQTTMSAWEHPKCKILWRFGWSHHPLCVSAWLCCCCPHLSVKFHQHFMPTEDLVAVPWSKLAINFHHWGFTISESTNLNTTSCTTEVQVIQPAN